MKIGEVVTVRVSKIANGFLVTESKSDGRYGCAESDALFYPSIDGVEAELVHRLHAAMKLETKEDIF